MRIFATLALIGFACLAQAQPQCSDVPGLNRADCHPEIFASPENCAARGCCWSVSQEPGAPWCFYPKNAGYTFMGARDTAIGQTISLTNNGAPSPYGGEIKNIALEVANETPTRLRLTFTDPSAARYRVPLPTPAVTIRPNATQYTTSYVRNNGPFSYAVTRASTGTTIFNTSFGALVYSDQFLQLSTLLPSADVYGLGEKVAPLKLDMNWKRVPIWARDQGTPEGYTNLYGAHPFFMAREPDGNFFGVFLLNSNAMEVALQPTPALTWRTTGGILDFYIFLGPTPDLVIQQYNEVIGHPYLPPYWSLGFHLCRWGYGSVARTKEINDRVRAAGIPMDVQWNDIDYMERYLDFTIDPAHFAELPKFVDELHEAGQRYVMIVDPGISNVQPRGSYAPYDQGVALGVFVNDTDGNEYKGNVWPGSCAFPDWTHPSAPQYWMDQIKNFHSKLAFDGLWIDMNEIALTGDVITKCGQNKYNNPPFMPAVRDASLSAWTMCADARQSAGVHYNIHSMYGHDEMILTSQALQQVRNKRALVISRSTFAGSGVHGGHWLGDNTATWRDLYLSIPGIISMNMFGLPQVGVDICGFNGRTTEELCSRWMQLGAFYPFSRNHNTIFEIDQDPAAFGPQLAAISRDALNIRYSLLPYLYTLFFDAHAIGSPVARALFFEFPTDNQVKSNDRQFMWGSGLLVSPVLEQGRTTVEAYLPAGKWYALRTGESITLSAGQTLLLPAPIDFIPLHFQGGHIIPTQATALTTDAARKLPRGLTVALSVNNTAKGHLVIDDGDSLNTLENGAFTLINYYVDVPHAGLQSLYSSVQHHGYNAWAGTEVRTITVLGVASEPASVSVNGAPNTSWTYERQVLTIRTMLGADTNWVVSWQLRMAETF